MISCPAMRQRAVTAMVVVAVAVSLAACGGDDSPASDPPLTRPSTSPTTEVRATADERELRQLANDFYDTYRRLVIAGTPDDGAIAALLTGDLERNVNRSLADLRARGLFGRRDPEVKAIHRIDRIIVVEDTAELVECFVDSGLVVRRSDGQVVDDTVTTRLSETTASRTEDGWRLASRRVSNEWPGVGGCADESG